MVAGALSRAGYYMGEGLMAANNSNPKGYFESREIEGINEDLLSQVVPPRRDGRIIGRFLRHRPGKYQRWLAQVPLTKTIPCPAAMANRIAQASAHQPFCFKDPRFCYTLPVWRAFLETTKFVCVFREPAVTAVSILKDSQEAEYLRWLHVTFRRAVAVWTLMYTHILEKHRHQGVWLFLHYNQVLSSEGLEQLETFLEAPVDRSFPDSRLRRTAATQSVSRETQRVYETLCRLAEYDASCL
jgi:hypothetical protein